jgi:hypothetical protein
VNDQDAAMRRRRTARSRAESTMTYTEERVASEMGRVLLALYRAGMQVRLWPDAMSGRAAARIVAGPSARRRAGPRSATGAGDSPLQAIYAAVERLNERAGAIVVPLD